MKVIDRMREIYHETATRYDRTVHRARLPHFLTLVRMLDLKGQEACVDLGCGPGNLTREVFPFVKHITGVDASPAMIDEAKRQFPTFDWRVGDATKTGLPAHHFDVAVTSQLLPWLARPEPFFAEIARITKPGAHIGIITAAANTYREFFQALEKLLKEYEEYYQTDSVNQVWGSRTYTVNQLKAFLEGAGFRLDAWTVLNSEVPSTAAEYLDVMRMFTNDHYLYPIPEERRPEAAKHLASYLHRDGLTLNERATILTARRT